MAGLVAAEMAARAGAAADISGQGSTVHGAIAAGRRCAALILRRGED